jgi:hypothetical protein
MKLQLLAFVLLLLSPATAADSSRSQRQTLSPRRILFIITAAKAQKAKKKPASLAGFLSLTLDFARLLAHLPPRRRASPPSHLLKLITQTPSSF